MSYSLESPAGPFYVQDKPREEFASGILDPDGVPVDLEDDDIIQAGLNGPDGVPVIATEDRTIVPDEDSFTMPWGDSSPFTVPGLYQLVATYNGVRLDPMPVVVEDPDNGWMTVAASRAQWRDTPDDPSIAFTLLEVARQQVLAYAPQLVEGARVPINYRQAQLMQARNIWNATRVDAGSGDLGEGSFALTPFPLDWQVKQVLRPKRAIPRIG